jgi:hypothetical protein
VSDDKETAERAKEMLVYGPLGLALFLRDSAPQFLRMFVARGRSEVEQRRRSMGGQLDQVRALGETVAADGGPEVLRLLSNGIATLREKAEEALGALGVTSTEEPAAATEATREVDWVATDSSAPNRDTADLAISGYDDLSASQVVDHLDGLPRADLDAIRDYEASHRARNTILGKIEQLTHGF